MYTIRNNSIFYTYFALKIDSTLLCLTEILPDALKTECSKCNAAQRNGAIKVISKLQKDYPTEWKKLSEKWDPTGEYFRKLTANIQTTSAKKN